MGQWTLPQLGQAGRDAQVVYFLRFHLDPLADTYMRGNKHTAIAHPLQATDPHALGFPQPAYFAVAPFHDHTVEPAVGAFAATLNDIGKARFTIVQLHASGQALLHIIVDLSLDPHQVLAIDYGRGVHQLVRQLTAVGKQQQPAGIEVQPANGNPAATAQTRQAIVNRGTTLRVVAGTYLTDGLVVEDHAQALLLTRWQTLSIKFDLVVIGNPLAQTGHLSVDRYSTCFNGAFHFPARSESRSGQDFLQFFAYRRCIITHEVWVSGVLASWSSSASRVSSKADSGSRSASSSASG